MGAWHWCLAPVPGAFGPRPPSRGSMGGSVRDSRALWRNEMLVRQLALVVSVLALSSVAAAADTALMPASGGVRPADIPPAVTFPELATPVTLPAKRILPSAAIARLRPTLIQHAAAGKQPTSSALVDDGATLVVTNRGDSTVSVYDSVSMRNSSTIIEVGYGAWGIAAKEASTLFVANWAGSTVALID